MKESDLFEPIKQYFTNQNYEVDGEILNCDLVACRVNEIVIVELKKTFSLKLVQQAIDRQQITSKVYVAIPKPQHVNYRELEKQVYLCKRLGIGLIYVDLSWRNEIKIMLEPRMKINIMKYRVKYLMQEFMDRKIKNTTGGVVGLEHYTAYFQKNIELACILEKEKSCSLKTIRDKYNFKNTSIVYQDFYKLFQREEQGIYSLSEKGYEELHSKKNKEVYEFYRLVEGK